MSDLPYFVRATAAGSLMEHVDWRLVDIEAGYCLDAPDMVPTGQIRVIYVPSSRHVPVSVAPTYTPRQS